MGPDAVRERGLGLRARMALFSTLMMTAAVLILATVVTTVFSAGLRHGTDELLAQDMETLRSLLMLNDVGRVELFSLAPEELANDELTKNIRFVVRDPTGAVLLVSPALTGVTLPLRKAVNQSPYDAQLHNERVRLKQATLTLTEGALSRTVVVQTVRSIQPFIAQEERLRWLLWGLLPVPIVLVALGSWLVATASLRPVNQMVTTVRDMSAHALDRRLPTGLNDEVGRLAATFNLLLERLERSFQSLTRFTADASHELRSPLTALRTQGEIALGRVRTPAEYQQVVGSMLEEIGRLEQMVDRLLKLARGDAGLVSLAPRELHLKRYLAEWIERYSALAEEKRVSFELQGPAETIAADPAILDHAIANLLDNAIRHSPAGGRIVIETWATPQTVAIAICDQGPGIPHAERERVFDRFVRLDTARTGTGAGLGLAMVKWACALHQGHVAIEDTAHGHCLIVTLPRRT